MSPHSMAMLNLIEGIYQVRKVMSDIAQSELVGHLTQSVNEIVRYPLEAMDIMETEHYNKFSQHYSSSESKEFKSWGLLNLDVAVNILSYLDAKDCSVMQQIDTFSNSVVSHQRVPLWQQMCLRTYGNRVITESPNSSPYYLFIHHHNLDLNNEIAHLNAAKGIYEAIYLYNRYYSRGIIGIVSDLAWLDDIRVARALSRKRFMAMVTLIMERDEDIIALKRAVHGRVHGISSFLTVESVSRAAQADNSIDVLSQHIGFPGFMGYAVNLIKLREEHEYLRRTVFWSLFRDLMVFETRVSKLEFKSLLEPQALKDFWGVALDDYSEDILNAAKPCFRSNQQRDLNAYVMNPNDRLMKLKKCLENGLHSETIIKYTY